MPSSGHLWSGCWTLLIEVFGAFHLASSRQIKGRFHQFCLQSGRACQSSFLALWDTSGGEARLLPSVIPFGAHTLQGSHGPAFILWSASFCSALRARIHPSWEGTEWLMCTSSCRSRNQVYLKSWSPDQPVRFCWPFHPPDFSTASPV